MTFAQAVRTVFAKYATFEGRASRAEYWWWAAFAAIVHTSFHLPAVVLITSNDQPRILTGLLAWVPCGLVAVAPFLPSLAVAVRRLHDTSRTGWWLLIAVIPVVNLVSWIALLVFHLQGSAPGTNRYGPTPTVTAANA